MDIMTSEKNEQIFAGTLNICFLSGSSYFVSDNHDHIEKQEGNFPNYCRNCFIMRKPRDCTIFSPWESQLYFYQFVFLVQFVVIISRFVFVFVLTCFILVMFYFVQSLFCFCFIQFVIVLISFPNFICFCFVLLSFNFFRLCFCYIPFQVESLFGLVLLYPVCCYIDLIFAFLRSKEE